jgi:hypothetical protein
LPACSLTVPTAFCCLLLLLLLVLLRHLPVSFAAGLDVL